jgi:hypothetical protein
MGRYLQQRAISGVIVLIGVSFLTFLMMHLLPGDPVDYMFARSQGDPPSPEQVQELRHQLGSTNYIVAHESGVIINFEASPEQTYPLYPQDGLLTHSNHFTATAAVIQAIGCDVGPDSLYRIQRVRDLLEPKLGDITVEDVQNALRDHAGHPRSVCRHSENGRDGSASIASIVIDLGAKTMHVASGPPCEHPYQTVGLPGTQGMGETDAHSQYAHVAAG